MWIYSQKTGQIKNNEKLIGTGYSGHGLGVNNPDMEDQKGIGPIPKGLYNVQGPHDSPNTGPYTLSLIPNPENKMYGRSGFACHGDSISNPGTASHGCIIAPRNIREAIWNSNDHLIKVV